MANTIVAVSSCISELVFLSNGELYRLTGKISGNHSWEKLIDKVWTLCDDELELEVLFTEYKLNKNGRL